jgi:hypothetical protein
MAATTINLYSLFFLPPLLVSPTYFHFVEAVHSNATLDLLQNVYKMLTAP